MDLPESPAEVITVLRERYEATRAELHRANLARVRVRRRVRSLLDRAAELVAELDHADRVVTRSVLDYQAQLERAREVFTSDPTMLLILKEDVAWVGPVDSPPRDTWEPPASVQLDRAYQLVECPNTALALGYLKLQAEITPPPPAAEPTEPEAGG